MKRTNQGNSSYEDKNNHISAYHEADCELALVELAGEPVDLVAVVHKNDCLGNGERLVEIAQRIQLPVFLVDGHVKLANT